MKYSKYFAGLTPKKGYSAQNSLSLAIASDLAYGNRKQIADTVKAWKFDLIDVISRKKGSDIDTQCFLMEDKKNIVVVFRGSNSKENWFANFQATQDPGPLKGTGAHEGFQDSLFPVVIALTQSIHDPNAPNRRIWITGHSLGGALCSLFAGMLFENGVDVYGIYTFASPRPASAEFSNQLNGLVKGPHFRVVNDGDIVPHVPPEPFYSHPGKRIILKAKKKENTSSSWLKQRYAALKHFIKVTGQKFDVADNHRLSADGESYIPRLIEDYRRSNS